jgi:preprotein translocase subunit SecG
MAEQEKDNTLTVVIAVTVVAIIGVFLLKQDETKHLKYSGETSAQAEAQVLAKHKDFNNDVLKQAQ